MASPDTVTGSHDLGTITGAEVASGGLWNAVSHLIPQVYTLVQSVVAARFLGPDAMGRQSFIAWAELSIMFLFAQGLPLALLRYTGETLGRGRPAAVRGMFRWAWRVELAAAALGGGSLVILALARPDLQAAWLLAAVACAAGMMRSVPLAVLRGVQRWREASLIGVISGFAMTVATVAVLAAGGGIAGMFAVDALISLASTVYARFRAHRVAASISPDSSRDRELNRRAAHFAIAASVQAVFTLIVWQRSEFLLLDVLSNAEEIALYSISFATVTALARFVQGFAAVMSPAVAMLLGAGERERIRTGFGRALRLLLLVSLPLSAGILAVGPELLRVVYGDDYRGTGPVLVLLMTAFPVIPVYQISGGVLQGLGRLRDIIAASVIATVADVALGVILIPRHGAAGAALANIGAQATAGVLICWFAVRKTGVVRWHMTLLARNAMASAVAGLAAWSAVRLATGPAAIAIGAAAGVAVFAASARVLRVIPTEDAVWLTESSPPRLRRLIAWMCRSFEERRHPEGRSAAISS